MTDNQAKAEGYTHHAKYFGIPCYYAEDGIGCRLTGKNWFYEVLTTPAMYIEGFLAYMFMSAERSALFQVLVMEKIK